MGKIKEPELITAHHDLNHFDCTNHSLNEWLKKRALKNQDRFSKTRVVCIENKVIAYYTLAFGSILRTELPTKVTRNSPNEIPTMILARLAVDQFHQGKGLAKHLLKEALLKTLEASRIGGLRGLIVHAIDSSAQQFYKHFGFNETPIDLTLFMSVEAIESHVSNK